MTLSLWLFCSECSLTQCVIATEEEKKALFQDKEDASHPLCFYLDSSLHLFLLLLFVDYSFVDISKVHNQTKRINFK